MRYVSCTAKAPMALYEPRTLRQLGERCVEHLKLLERTDTIHFLSYVGPVLARGTAMRIDEVLNLLLIAGFEKREEEERSSNRRSLLLKGLLPSKPFEDLPIEVHLVVVAVAVSEKTMAGAEEEEEEVAAALPLQEKLYSIEAVKFQASEGGGA